MEDDMEGENRTSEKSIGEIAHAQEQSKRTTGHLPPHGPGAPEEKRASKVESKAEDKKGRQILTAIRAEHKWANIPAE